MKLTFILVKKISHKDPIKGFKEVYKTATTWPEIEHLVSQGYSPILKKHFLLVKAIELNKTFWDTIHDIRESCGNSRNGHSKSAVLSTYFQYVYMFFKERQPFVYPASDVVLNKIDSALNNIDTDLISQMPLLFLGNFIGAPLFPSGTPVISCEDRREQLGPMSYLCIKITNRCSLDSIKRFLTDNSEEIQPILNMLPVKSSFCISERDIRVCELKDKEHKKFKEISKIIRSEFANDPYEEKINQNSMIKAHNRALKHISSLFHNPNVT